EHYEKQNSITKVRSLSKSLTQRILNENLNFKEEEVTQVFDTISPEEGEDVGNFKFEKDLAKETVLQILAQRNTQQTDLNKWFIEGLNSLKIEGTAGENEKTKLAYLKTLNDTADKDKKERLSSEIETVIANRYVEQIVENQSRHHLLLLGPSKEDQLAYFKDLVTQKAITFRIDSETGNPVLMTSDVNIKEVVEGETIVSPARTIKATVILSQLAGVHEKTIKNTDITALPTGAFITYADAEFGKEAQLVDKRKASAGVLVVADPASWAASQLGLVHPNQEVVNELVAETLRHEAAHAKMWTKRFVYEQASRDRIKQFVFDGGLADKLLISLAEKENPEIIVTKPISAKEFKEDYFNNPMRSGIKNSSQLSSEEKTDYVKNLNEVIQKRVDYNNEVILN
ncbi:MAG: hypothetical protein WCI04_07410, partial [archaeon]